MALYELTDEQRAATLGIIGNASILGRAAAMVASIQRALASPVTVRGVEQPEPESEAASE